MPCSRFVRALALAAAAFALLTPDAFAQGHGGRHGSHVFRPAFGYGWGFYGGYYWPAFGLYSGAAFWPPYGWAYAYPYAVVADGRASVRVQVTPRETEVFVDGYYAGIVDQYDGLFQRLMVPPGEHAVELYLQGYRTARRDLHVEPGGAYKIRYQMEALAPGEEAPERPVPPERTEAPAPAPSTRAAPGAGRAAAAPAGFGVLRLHTQPEEVEVLVDGERWPATRGELTLHLPAGRHRLELRRAGYETFSTEIEITAGEESPLNVMLARAQEGEL